MSRKCLVREGRLELPWVAPLDPKSSASASFATRAFECLREFTSFQGSRGALYARPGSFTRRRVRRPERAPSRAQSVVQAIKDLRQRVELPLSDNAVQDGERYVDWRRDFIAIRDCVQRTRMPDASTQDSSRRIGIVNVNVEPSPTWLLTQIFPPWSSTNFRHRVSPKPVPSTFLAAVPTWRNSSKTFS